MLFWISVYILGLVVNAAALTAEAYMDGYKPVDRAAWVRVCCFAAGSWASWAVMLLFFLWCVWDDIHNGHIDKDFLYICSMERDGYYRRHITCARWLRLRKRVLSEHPTCVRCAERGEVSAATEVHHVVPVEHGLNDAERERLMFSPSNLQALCHACHVAAHVEMGRSSKAGVKARTEEQLKRLEQRYFD